MAERLSQMAEQMQMFLTKQVDRLEKEIGAAPGGKPDFVEYQRLVEEFQEVRQAWELERDAEKDRLVMESERLVEAWKKLEAEQRETLKQRVLRTAGGEARVGGQGGGALASQRLAGPSNTVAVADCDSRSPTSRNGQIPFQQLRREMMEHARQRRKR
ncbi:MAG: hypothetical protein CMJ80_05865 [Planctomycetaceae bacterium]|nr:hypothetical protein [Planctomycetaceae bacterium]